MALSVTLSGFVPPGVNQLPNKQLLDQSCPGIFGVAAVGGDAVGLNHGAAPEWVDLRKDARQTQSENTDQRVQIDILHREKLKSPYLFTNINYSTRELSPPSAGEGLFRVPHTAP